MKWCRIGEFRESLPQLSLLHDNRRESFRSSRAINSTIRPGNNVTNELKVRVAAPGEKPVLADLIASSARTLSHGYYTEQETASAIAYVFGVNTALIGDGTYFVATLNDQIAGCGGWSRRRTLYGGDQRPIGTQDLLDPAHEPARIRAFFVAPTAARRGVGRGLFVECVRAATASGFRSFELMATLPGVPFYSALGFNVVEHVTDILPDGTPIRFVACAERHDED